MPDQPEPATPAQVWLTAQGHDSSSGHCEKCWREAHTLYANGQGAYESLNSAYHDAIRRAEDAAIAATRRPPDA